MLQLDGIAKLLVTALMLLGALAASPTVSAAPERPQARSELSEGQKIVIEIENEKARLGVRGFSPLRNFPVGEVKWSGTR